jgi:hypothetical protein
MPNRDKRSLGHVPRLVFRFPGFIRFTAYTELIHVDVKPAARTSDRCQLTHYGSLEERIIAKSLIDRAMSPLESKPVHWRCSPQNGLPITTSAN